MRSLSIKPRLKQFVRRTAQTLVHLGLQEQRFERNIEIALAALLGDGRSLAAKNNVTAYVEFLRGCIEPASLRIDVIKPDKGGQDALSNRFATLIDTMRSSLFPLPAGVALAVSDCADRFRGLAEPFERERWSGDVGLHFAMSSSSPRKCRVLATIVRLSRAKQCLELGTAYGLSAMVILEMQRMLGSDCHLTTIEGSNPQFALASAHLNAAYSAAVTCHFGHTQKLLPEIAARGAAIDFMFHDAGHSYDDYVKDFGAIVAALAPGAVVLIDDIRWEDPRFQAASNTYRGWLDVVAHPRVRQAVELDGAMGLVQLT